MYTLNMGAGNKSERPLLIDLYCGGGGGSQGYFNAGFRVIGVDNKPQKNYPFKFYLADALTFPLNGAAAVHASPPCQKYTRMNKGLLQSLGFSKKHPDLIGKTRARLKSSGIPYIMENVEGAPLETSIMLCGSMFNLLVQRHRYFECSFFVLVPKCQHDIYKKDKPPLHGLRGKSSVVGCYGHGRGKGDTVKLWQKAMGIDWMTRRELAEAIPPAYTEWIGKRLLKILNGRPLTG